MSHTIYPEIIRPCPDDFVPGHQGMGNKCQSHAFGNCWDIRRERALAFQLTAVGRAVRDAIYFDGKRYNGGPGGDLGATFWQLQRSLAMYGVPTFPWVDGGDLSSTNPPPPEVYASGAANKPVVFEMVPYIRSGPSKDSTHETIAMLLTQGHTLPVTMLLSSNFWSLPTGGDADDIRYVFDPTDQRGEHAVLLVGRNHKKRTYQFINSWGPGFGAMGRFTVTYDDLLRCVTQLWYIKDCPIPLVKEFDIMTNPVPTALTAGQQSAADIRIRAALVDAFTRDADGDGQADAWVGALKRGGELLLSCKQFEKYAGLPRFTVQDHINRGIVPAPAGMAFDMEP